MELHVYPCCCVVISVTVCNVYIQGSARETIGRNTWASFNYIRPVPGHKFILDVWRKGPKYKELRLWRPSRKPNRRSSQRFSLPVSALCIFFLVPGPSTMSPIASSTNCPCVRWGSRTSIFAMVPTNYINFLFALRSTVCPILMCYANYPTFTQHYA